MRKKLRAMALLLAVSLSLAALSAPVSASAPTPQPEDTFQFSNSANYFSSYHVSSTYLTHLKENEPRSYQAYIGQMDGRAWQGSCFGMSAVYCLARGGGIDLWRFLPGADTLRELEAPKDSQSTQDLVNYYMLAQCTSAVSAYAGAFAYSYDETNRRWVDQEVNQRIVKELAGESGYSLLAFSYSGGGHTVVAKGIYTGTDGSCHIDIWDPNYPNRSGGELVISGDCATAQFGLAAPNVYNDGLRLLYVMPYSTRAQTYDAKSIQSVFGYGTAAAPAFTPLPTCILTSSADTFTVTAGDGRAAVVRGGEQAGGQLSLARLPLATGRDGAYRYLVHESDAKEGLTVSFDAGNNEVQYVSSSLYARVSAANLTDVTVSDGAVSAVCAGAGGQNIVMASDRLDSARSQVTASGQGADLTLGIENGQVRVSSSAASAVTVTSANASTQAVSDTQTLVAGADGILAVPNAAAQNAASTPPYTYTPPYTGQTPAAGQNAASGSQTVPGYSWSAPAADNYYSAFTDVGRNDLYFYPVLWAQRKGVTNGYNGSISTFAPNMPVSRGEAVTFLWRSKGSPVPKGSAVSFSDVSPGSYCAQAVRWAVEQGIANGSGPSAFSPERQVTRGEMVTFLWRMAGQPGGYAEAPFTDVPAYCAQAVRWAAGEGIAGGYGSAGTFAPNVPLTRAETVAFLWRAAGCPVP